MPSRTHQLDLGRVGARVVGVDDDGLLAFEDAQRLGVAGDVEERLDLVDPVGRVVAERLDPAGGTVPVADDALVDAHRAGEVAGHQVGDLARVEAARQLGAHVEQPAQLAGEVLACGSAGGPTRRRWRPGRRGSSAAAGRPAPNPSSPSLDSVMTPMVTPS